MAVERIETPERLLFHLLMLGHEIAHLVHRHLDGSSDQSDEDYRSLELWADFYGAKVAMALLTYGKQLHPIAKTFWSEGDMHALLSNIGDAVGLLVSHVYRKHRKYPSILERAGLTSNGVLSFVRNYYGSSFDLRFYYSVPLRVFANPAVIALIPQAEAGEYLADEPVRRAAQWHRTKQGGASARTPGLIPDVVRYLDTNFDFTDEEISEARRARLEEVKRSGVLDHLVADRVADGDEASGSQSTAGTGVGGRRTIP
jgi:hypothetical protein